MHPRTKRSGNTIDCRRVSQRDDKNEEAVSYCSLIQNDCEQSEETFHSSTTSTDNQNIIFGLCLKNTDF